MIYVLIATYLFTYLTTYNDIDLFEHKSTTQFCPQIISYDSPRGGVNVVTEKGTVTTSHLLIQEARVEDNGRYQCNPSNSQPKSINVHVLNGER